MSEKTSWSDLPFSLNADQIASLLSISRAGAYNLLKRKDFPCLHIGGRYVVPRDKFLEWIDKNSKPAE